MRTVNLYHITRIREQKLFAIYEAVCSERMELHQIEQQELDSLRRLVDQLIQLGVEVKELDDFYYSYSPCNTKNCNISRGLNLLKMGNGTDYILNIELGLKVSSLQEMEKHMQRRKDCLSDISKNANLYTYISKTNEVYKLEHNTLCSSSLTDLCQEIKNWNQHCNDRIAVTKRYVQTSEGHCLRTYLKNIEMKAAAGAQYPQNQIRYNFIVLDEVYISEKAQSERKSQRREALSAFIAGMLDNKRISRGQVYDNIDIVYANDKLEELRIREYYQAKGDGESIVLLDSNYSYGENGQLQVKVHPDIHLFYWEQLFHGLNEEKDRLCIIVLDNVEILKRLLWIKSI